MDPLSEAAAAMPPASLWADRARRWTGILAAYFSTQTLVQLLGVAAGLLLVRNLPVREYALYTLGTSVVTFFTFATDLGSSSSLLHFFHRSRKENEDFAPYLSAVLSLRRAAYLFGAVVVVVALPTIATARGFGLRESLLASAAVILGVGFQIRASLSVLVLRLRDRYGVSYRAELAAAALRVVLVAAMIATAALRSWIGLAASAAGTALLAWLSRGGIADAGPADREHRRRILRYLLPTLPSAAYFAFQGPLVVWLAAAFGGTRNIAEVGALGRLGMIVGIFSSITGVVLLPRLAQVADDRRYRRLFHVFAACLAAVALALLAGVALAPRAVLSILGPNYLSLDRGLLLVLATAGINLLGGYVVNVNLARSWTRYQPVTVVIEVAVVIALVAFLPISQTTGLLTMSLLSSATGTGLQLLVCEIGFWRPEVVLWR